MACCKHETEQSQPNPRPSRSEITLALAGNPNSGKSALFNAFTGIRQKTGNWPGVTVERKHGHARIGERDAVVIDLPGIYSLDAVSMDEKVTRDYLLSQDADIIINVIDASNLERNLYLTVQMLEMGVPMVVALNMMDVARRRGVVIDLEHLSARLGCPVVPVVAVSGEGLGGLQKAILDTVAGQAQTGFRLAHDEVIEQGIADLIAELDHQQGVFAKHWLALKMLEGDTWALAKAPNQLQDKITLWRDRIEQRSGEEADIHIADQRYSHAHTLANLVITEPGKLTRTTTDKIDQVILSRWFGIPIFLLVMYLMFMFSINIGGAFIDFFDGVAGALFVDGFKQVLASIGMPEWLQVLLTDGAGAGLQVVATFIPIIATLYLFLSVIEDSGYMARAAFVMDRAMRSIGLPGKAFVPLIVGFGCNVSAIMATRTLENSRERKLTILMNPFMSCGARLPVYALFAAAFFPSNGQNIVFGLYLIGILVAIGTGLVMKKTLLPGQSTGFLMELPSYHLPTIKGVLLRTWDRLRLFLREAGQVIVIMVIVINVLNSIGTDGSFGNEDTNKSVLGAVGQAVTPAFAPMGIEADNWPATVGIFTGILAKEVVVGALDSMYSALADESNANTVEEVFSFSDAISAAAATVPVNLKDVFSNFTDPFGLDVGEITDVELAAADQEVKIDTFGAMTERFDGQAGAFAYLLFILMYFPCVATIGAVVREAGAAWAAFVAAWTTSVAYVSATVFYQVATFSEHPSTSLSWVFGLLLFAVIAFVGLRRWAVRGGAYRTITVVGAKA